MECTVGSKRNRRARLAYCSLPLFKDLHCSQLLVRGRNKRELVRRDSDVPEETDFLKVIVGHLLEVIAALLPALASYRQPCSGSSPSCRIA